MTVGMLPRPLGCIVNITLFTPRAHTCLFLFSDFIVLLQCLSLRCLVLLLLLLLIIITVYFRKWSVSCGTVGHARSFASGPKGSFASVSQDESEVSSTLTDHSKCQSYCHFVKIDGGMEVMCHMLEPKQWLLLWLQLGPHKVKAGGRYDTEKVAQWLVGCPKQGRRCCYQAQTEE